MGMATINVTPEEFANLTVSFILDKLLHPDEVVTGSEDFNKLSKVLSGKGMKGSLTQHYLTTSSTERLNYKRIKDIFDGSTSSIQQIRIGPKKEISKKEKEKEKESLVKKIGKKVLKKLIGQGPMSLSKEEWQTLNEMIEWMDEIREENING